MGFEDQLGMKLKIAFKDVLQWPSGIWKLVHFEECFSVVVHFEISHGVNNKGRVRTGKFFAISV